MRKYMNKLYKLIRQTYTRNLRELKSKPNNLKSYFMFSPRSLLKKYSLPATEQRVYDDLIII